MDSKISLKSEVDYLEGLANYLSLQIVEHGGELDFDVTKPLSSDLLRQAIDNINKFVKKPEEDEEHPPTKAIIE
ncbi:hypothetical protein TVAG_077650 [Trichomonas vaginalis G3]|uniref:Uncharacterized protein n=1 Tax=Trichomonas vaginalis (strain ATCC PRA-98 / G3) TaxID=412133 RepID=A2E2X2_TRIV3|nr:hypothetical protein TVAGG3_0896010 [Trichomonas vaginalis G3]EAY13027.1 hypothetical protein TVAG_077650 [Trichomonas vaginalis G3]KAI5503071.1 hypothetical protein TVAGG3_0896010 [Trichomonas vaginalis G3]|eukprot:XP_001325250.1 hypothetical protein [Trichomonas vaginalis G3]